MNPEEEKAAAALERLVAALLDHPRKLEFDATRLPSRVNVRVRVDVEDAGKVIGIKGAHVKALQLVAARLGDRLGQLWALRVDDPEEAPRPGKKQDAPPAASFDPFVDVQLLSEVLACLIGLGFTCDYRRDPGSGDAWTFVVVPAGFAEHETLVDKAPGSEETLVAALGTLFRAVGRRQGVGYKIELPRGAQA